MTSPFVSIIVPVYKAEMLLPRCIDSILSQSFSDWELILIDDGSPDASGALCDQFASQDFRIRVLHKTNGGVSSARNFGLELATGQYVTFIDADDYVKSSFLERMISQGPADLIICGFENIGPDSFVPDAENITLQVNAKALYKLIDIPYYLDAPWCKLYRRQLIIDNKHHFNRGLSLGEDTLFCYEYLSFCNIVHVISDELYVYDGLWGGDNKYILTYDELNYASKRVVGALDRLNKKFNSNIDTRYKGWHLSKLKGLFSDYQDVDIFKLYLQSHKPISFDDFMSDNRLSPLSIGISQTYRFIRERKYAECQQHLRNLKRFITKTPHRYPSRKQQLFYTSLFIFGDYPTMRLMKFVLNK